MLPAPSRLYYSVKANPHPDVIAHLLRLGCMCEVSSPGELQTVIAAGGDLGSCLYSGPAKTLPEIAAAINAGVRHFSVESTADYHRVRSIASPQSGVKCLIRVSQRPAGGAGLRMSGAGAQFGIESSQFDPAEFPPDQAASVAGLHFFPLSNARDEDQLVTEFQASIEFAAKVRQSGGLAVGMVDLGGGFAAPYAMPGEEPAYPALREALTRSLDGHLPGWRDGSPTIMFESGRHLVASAGQLLTTVVEVRKKGAHTYVLLDTGIHQVGGLSGTGRLLPTATPLPVPGRLPDVAAQVTLAGPLCTPADVLGRQVVVGEVAAGDLLVLPNTGAYGLTASVLGFLSRPTPVEIVIEGGQVCSATRIELHRARATTDEAKAVLVSSEESENDRD